MGSFRKTRTILTLYSQGYKFDTIVEKMGLSEIRVKSIYSDLKCKGYLPVLPDVSIKNQSHKKHSEIDSLVDEFLMEHLEYVINLKSKSKKKQIVCSVEKVAEIVKSLGYKKQHVKLLLNLYLERKLYEDALAFLYDYKQNAELSPEDLKIVADIKHRLRIYLLERLTGDVPSYIEDNPVR